MNTLHLEHIIPIDPETEFLFPEFSGSIGLNKENDNTVKISACNLGQEVST